MRLPLSKSEKGCDKLYPQFIAYLLKIIKYQEQIIFALIGVRNRLFGIVMSILSLEEMSDFICHNSL